MQKMQTIIILILLAAVTSASLIYTVSFAAPTERRGAISIAFDDGMQSTYDYAFPLMQTRGIKATFHVVTDWIRDFSYDNAYMSIAELQTLQNNGYEITSHSKTHTSFIYLSDSQIQYECSASKQLLQSYGLTVNNFAYPYGSRNEHIDSIVAQYYRSARGAYVAPYVIQFPVSQFLLPGFAGETGDLDALPQLINMVNEVYETNGWAIIFFHNVVPDLYYDPYAISSQDFESFLDYILFKGVSTITVNQGLDLSAPPAAPPAVMISPTSAKMYPGQSQTFSSSVSDGNPPFSYQWVLDGAAISGATSPTWTFTPTTTGTFNIYLNVTDTLNNKVKSNIAEASVSSPPSVTISPVDVDMIVGSSQQFTSSVTGGFLPCSYQWYVNGTVVLGAASADWTFTPAATGTYKVSVAVNDGVGTAQSNSATVRVGSPLVAVVSPSSVSLNSGESSEFSASVSGGFGPFSYQWVSNGTVISDATSPTWTFTPTTTGTFNIYLNVTDTLNNKVKSNIAEASVSSPPAPTPSPTPTPTPTPAPTPAPTPTPTPAPTAAPTPAPTSTPSPTPADLPEPQFAIQQEYVYLAVAGLACVVIGIAAFVLRKRRKAAV
jgi:peptidoglycan/xylan/chitin deacetylase (PgdA/CDA1 family)